MGTWYEHDDILAAWLFDGEGAGDVALDYGWYAASLEDDGTVGRVAGVFSDAANFSGSNTLWLEGFRRPLLGLNSNVHFTVMLWAKYDQGTIRSRTEPHLAGKWGVGGKNQWRISWVPGAQSISMTVTGNGSTPVVTVGTGTYADCDTWQHFAFTFDGSTLRSYYNGTLVDSESFDGINVSGSDDVNFHLGWEHGKTDGTGWYGALDDVGMFSGIALSVDDINTIKDNGLASSMEFLMEKLFMRLGIVDILDSGLDVKDLPNSAVGVAGLLSAEVGISHLLNPAVGIHDTEEEIDA